MNLHDLWALPLVEQQHARVYQPWGYGRAEQLAKENAAPDFPKVGRFYLLPRTDGRTVIVDPLLPWNAAALSDHATSGEAEIAAQHYALMHPGDQNL
jgi:hypothetical protein